MTEINKDKFENMCALQLTEEDIAFFFDCSIDTISRWCAKTYGKTFADVFSQKRVLGKLSHRAAQFAMAKNNPTMSIWLGKQYFGQHDIMQVDIRKTQEEATDETLALLREIEDEEHGEEAGSAADGS